MNKIYINLWRIKKTKTFRLVHPWYYASVARSSTSKIFRGRAVLPNHLGSNYLIDIITSLTISEVVRGVTKETIFYIEKRKEKENSLAWVPSLPIVIVIITLTYYTSSSYLIMSIISCLRAAFYHFLPILFIIFAFSPLISLIRYLFADGY